MSSITLDMATYAIGIFVNRQDNATKREKVVRRRGKRQVP